MPDHLLPRVLLSLMTIHYGCVTILADFNATNAAVPKWTPRARFRLVWQITTYAGFGTLALIRRPGPFAIERFNLAAATDAIIHATSFIPLPAAPLYGGRA